MYIMIQNCKSIYLFAVVIVMTNISCSSNIYLVRHADKILGVPNPHLSEAGKKRAKTLADTLSNKGISKVFSTDSNRTRETARPTMDLNAIPLTIYRKDNLPALVSSLKSHLGSNILVVAHSEDIDDILHEFGLTLNQPITGYSRFIKISRRKFFNIKTTKRETHYGILDE